MAAELLKQYEPEIEQVILIPSEDGRFEVELNGTLIYSKLTTLRHAQPGEVMRLVQQYLKERK